MTVGGSRTGETVGGIEIARQTSRVASLASGSGSWCGERIEEAVIAKTCAGGDVEGSEFACITCIAGCRCVGSAVETCVMAGIANV